MNYPFDSCWYKLPEKMVVYTEQHLKSWTKRELLIMHWHLTRRLDGYGHETADQSIKDNCVLFRKVLVEMGEDPIKNVIDNEEFYNWGNRSWHHKTAPMMMIG